MSLLVPKVGHGRSTPSASRQAKQPEQPEPPHPAEPIVRLAGLTKRFGPVRVLNGLDLDVRPGELLALVGENGAGKSTIVNCIAGVVMPDSGEVLLRGEPLAGSLTGLEAHRIAVVWQDLALCDNLDTVANLFLGRERGHLMLNEAAMHREANRLLAQLGIHIDDVRRPVITLSGGQRQSIALARAMMDEPELLILDEPTASLGVTETQSVVKLIRQLRARGTSILLVTHDLDQVFELADRIVILRQGRIVATVLPREVHPDEVVAVMSGAEVESTARKQLQRLRSLVDQLSEADPAASLPLIVSAMASALGQDKLCVHLLQEANGDPPSLRLVAAVGLPAPLIQTNHDLSVGVPGGPAGLAAATHRLVVVEDVRADPLLGELRQAATQSGVLSAWAAPIVGAGGVIGTVSGYGDAVGQPTDDQLELVSLYASHAAAAIERDQLLDEATRRNRVLETLREILERLAGPEQVHGGLEVAAVSLCRGLGADAVAIHDEGCDGSVTPRLAVTAAGEAPPAEVAAFLAGTAEKLLVNAGLPAPAGHFDDATRATILEVPDGRAVLSAWWRTPEAVGDDAMNLLDDAARSLQLAIEREALLVIQQQAAALRRSNGMQRQFLSRLSHELRTPLTAIQGYVSTLRQPDVIWDSSSQFRFLDRIGVESARMVRLVGDLLDSSAIEAGILRVEPHWCDLPLVLDAAIACLPPEVAQAVEVRCDPAVGPIWADHDRMEQLLVNLLENAIRHTPEGTRVTVTATPGPANTVVVQVIDDGPGITAALAERMFQPHERGLTVAPGAGLGLTIARGIVDAHGGRLSWRPTPTGTCFEVILPVDPPADDDASGNP